MSADAGIAIEFTSRASIVAEMVGHERMQALPRSSVAPK